MKLNLSQSALLLGFILTCLTSLNPTASGETCEALFETAHVEDFLRLGNESLTNEVRNPAARGVLIRKLANKLASGSFNADVDGQVRGLSVYFNENSTSFQIRLGSAHLSTSEATPLLQSKLDGSKGQRTGLAVRFQFLDGEKLVVTNTVISGDETTYLGLVKKEIRVEFDLSGGPITTLLAQETVSTTSNYRKDDTSYTIPRTIKILSRR